MIDIDKFGKKIYYTKFKTLLGYGNILLNQGYFESKNKPNLFCKHIPEGWFYADMRGTMEVPIWSDTSPLFYWKFEESVPYWKRRRLIEQEYKKLLSFDCYIRTSFEVYDSPEISIDNSTESSLIEWSEGYFYWENGFCKSCNKDMQKEGLFCCKDCEEKYEDELKKPCNVCGKKINFGEEISHHICYFPEKIIIVHRSCHNQIHKTNLYPNLKPNKEDIKRFYNLK